MRKTQRFTVSLALGLSLLLAGCGDDERRQFPGPNTYVGFRIINYIPLFNDEMVPLTTQVSLDFSESVNPDTIPGNFQVLEQRSNGTPLDITAETSHTLQNGGRTLIVVFSRNLIVNARYTVQLTSNVKSVAGNSLDPFVLPFTTGSNLGMGFGNITVAGPPAVVSISIFQDFYVGPCLGFTVDFNEDLQLEPDVRARICTDAGFLGEDCGGWMPLRGYPPNPMQNRTWIFTFNDGGCSSCQMYGLLTKIDVSVREAFDMEGERATNLYQDRFSYATGIGLSGEYDSPPWCY